MGGINHYITNRTSPELTVPGARALTDAVSELMLGNSHVESAIMAGAQVGICHNELTAAANCFARSAEHLGNCRFYVEHCLEMLGRGDYEPFSPAGIDIPAFVRAAVADGLLPASDITSTAQASAISGGHDGLFVRTRELIDHSVGLLSDLEVMTREMASGPEGKQGYFWHTVETNRRPWRQAYMKAQTALLGLLTFWSTGAAISTEVHLQATAAPSLLSYAEVT